MERLVLLDRQPALGLEFLPEKMLKILPAPGVASETIPAASAMKKDPSGGFFVTSHIGCSVPYQFTWNP